MTNEAFSEENNLSSTIRTINKECKVKTNTSTISSIKVKDTQNHTKLIKDNSYDVIRNNFQQFSSLNTPNLNNIGISASNDPKTKFSCDPLIENYSLFSLITKLPSHSHFTDSEYLFRASHKENYEGKKSQQILRNDGNPFPQYDAIFPLTNNDIISYNSSHPMENISNSNLKINETIESVLEECIKTWKKDERQRKLKELIDYLHELYTEMLEKDDAVVVSGESGIKNFKKSVGKIDKERVKAYTNKKELTFKNCKYGHNNFETRNSLSWGKEYINIHPNDFPLDLTTYEKNLSQMQRKVTKCSTQNLEYSSNNETLLEKVPSDDENFIISMKKSYQKTSHVKRPLNAFMVWAKEERKKILNSYPEIHNSEISKILGFKWNKMPREEKQPYFMKQMELGRLHMEKYPDYKYRPKPSKAYQVDGKWLKKREYKKIQKKMKDDFSKKSITHDKKFESFLKSSEPSINFPPFSQPGSIISTNNHNMTSEGRLFNEVSKVWLNNTGSNIELNYLPFYTSPQL